MRTVVEKIMPRYPIYVPSKGRADRCLTARFLIKDGVPFHLVVEPQEEDVYAAFFGKERLLVLPFRDRGLIFARNWIKEHATDAGHLRHWQLDDNIRMVRRRFRGKRVPCRFGVALAVVEDFVDRYENVAVAGLNYRAFVVSGTRKPPFHLNQRVYSCSLILNSLPHKWRSKYNDDTDFCLQVLADGWCTILFNAFFIDKVKTMTVKGGNTPIYQGDGRLKMARSLERLWPGVVTTHRRFGRPQHHVKDHWRRFDTPLKLKPGIDLDGLGTDEHGMRLVQVRSEIESEELAELMQDRIEEVRAED